MKPMYASHTPKKKVCITYVACVCVRADGAVRLEIERPHPSQRSRVCLDLRSKGRITGSSRSFLWQAGANKFLIRKTAPVRPFSAE